MKSKILGLLAVFTLALTLQANACGTQLTDPFPCAKAPTMSQVRAGVYPPNVWRPEQYRAYVERQRQLHETPEGFGINRRSNYGNGYGQMRPSFGNARRAQYVPQWRPVVKCRIVGLYGRPRQVCDVFYVFR